MKFLWIYIGLILAIVQAKSLSHCDTDSMSEESSYHKPVSNLDPKPVTSSDSASNPEPTSTPTLKPTAEALTAQHKGKLLVDKDSPLANSENTLLIENFPEPRRVIKPGQAITRDFREERINFQVGTRGLIDKIWYG